MIIWVPFDDAQNGTDDSKNNRGRSKRRTGAGVEDVLQRADQKGRRERGDDKKHNSRRFPIQRRLGDVIHDVHAAVEPDVGAVAEHLVESERTLRVARGRVVVRIVVGKGADVDGFFYLNGHVFEPCDVGDGGRDVFEPGLVDEDFLGDAARDGAGGDELEPAEDDEHLEACDKHHGEHEESSAAVEDDAGATLADCVSNDRNELTSK